jgi:hypothetical protein
MPRDRGSKFPTFQEGNREGLGGEQIALQGPGHFIQEVVESFQGFGQLGF